MSLGLSFRGSRRRSLSDSTANAVGQAVQTLRSRFGYAVYQDSPTQMILEFCPTGLLSIRVDGDVIEGGAASTPAGPGFHKAVVDLIDGLAGEAGLAMDVEDATGYWGHRDFQRLRQEQVTWLRALIGQVATGDQTTLRITWPANGWAPADLTGIITPMGCFSHVWLRAELQRDNLEEFARRFFVWPNPERDALYHRATALYLMWNECRWVKPQGQAEEALLAEIFYSLRQASQQDPTLPLPLAAWTELVELTGGSPHDVVKGADMLLDGPVGYRRGDVMEPFPGGWRVRLPGTFLKRREEGGGYVYWDTNWNLRLTTYRYESPPPGTADPTDRLMPDPTLDEVLEDHRYQGAITYESGEQCWVLQGLIRGPGGMAVVTITWADPQWADWSIETFRSIEPPPLTSD